MKAIACTLLLASLAAALLATVAAPTAMAGNRHCDNCGQGKHAAKRATRAQYGPYPQQTYRSSGDHINKQCFGQCRGHQYRPWHGSYYHTEYGAPVALVMPPTAELTTNMGWGVGNTRVTKMCQQFARPNPGYGGYGVYPMRPTPRWPSDTMQFGVYPVRAPFK